MCLLSWKAWGLQGQGQGGGHPRACSSAEPTPPPAAPRTAGAPTHRGGLDAPAGLRAGPAGPVDEQVTALPLQAGPHVTPLLRLDDPSCGEKREPSVWPLRTDAPHTRLPQGPRRCHQLPGGVSATRTRHGPSTEPAGRSGDGSSRARGAGEPGPSEDRTDPCSRTCPSPNAPTACPRPVSCRVLPLPQPQRLATWFTHTHTCVHGCVYTQKCRRHKMHTNRYTHM